MKEPSMSISKPVGRRRSPIQYSRDAATFAGGFQASEVEAAAAFFDEYGFAVFRSFLSPAEVAEVRENLERYQREVAPTLDERDAIAPPVAKGRYSLLGRMDYYDSYFRGLSNSDRFKNLAKILLKSEVAPVHIQYFNIIPGIGQPTPPHQDARNLQLRDGRMVNFWLALTAVNQVNGCLHYIPGSHKLGKRYHEPAFGDFGPIVIKEYGDADRAKEISLHVEPGDLLVHHGLTIHCSEENQSETERCALGFPFISDEDARQSVEEWNQVFRR